MRIPPVGNNNYSTFGSNPPPTPAQIVDDLDGFAELVSSTTFPVSAGQTQALIDYSRMIVSSAQEAGLNSTICGMTDVLAASVISLVSATTVDAFNSELAAITCGIVPVCIEAIQQSE
ncbi:MAG: hypothetical protein HY860_04020 [Chlamydiales bacterium]|nr:hypothetical protein [Chlamydiales bacterium]